MTSVVVGVDGSDAANRAAVWAIDEAVSRDVPLRLLAVAEHVAAGAESAAESALQAAASAVVRTGRVVGVQTAVVTGAPTLTLLEASRSAAMICVGAVGMRHPEHSRLGSTAAALAASAHCPVAVVRNGAGSGGRHGWVVVHTDPTPHSAAVLAAGVAEARLRGAALRVLGSAEQLQTDRSQWRHRYPDLDAQPAVVRGGVLNYLAEHVADVQLVVVGARERGAVAELLGPGGQSALHGTGCSILVVDAQRLV